MWTTTDLLDRSDNSGAYTKVNVFTTDNPGTIVITHTDHETPISPVTFAGDAFVPCRTPISKTIFVMMGEVIGLFSTDVCKNKDEKEQKNCPRIVTH